MADKTRFGTFDQLIDLAPMRLRPIMSGLRGLVLDVHPQVVEVVRLGDRATTYGLGPKKMSEGYAYILPHERWVNLGFFQGAGLPDPEALLEGTGARMRHVKVRTEDVVDSPAVRTLVVAAVEERRVALGR